MSDEIKKDNVPHDNDEDKKASADSASAESPLKLDAEKAEDASKAEPQKRGIGFLGRRGTAPIKTEPKKDAAPKKETAPEAPKPVGIAEKIFVKIAEIPVLAVLILIFIFCLHNVASIWLPSVFFEQELYLLEVYTDMKGMGQWLIPPSTEHVSFILPGFFWFMALVDLIPLTDAIFLPLVTTLTMLIAVMGVYVLGLSVGLGARVSFAAGLLTLSSPFFADIGHCVRPDLFTAGLFALALAFLHRGWVNTSAPTSFILGFFFTALATLSGGFLPLWAILISSIIFICWRGTFGRANKLDAVIGFGVLVCIFAAWLVVIIIGGGPQAEALEQFMQHMISPFAPPFWPLAPLWYSSFIWLVIGLAPWVLLPLFVSWVRVLKNTLTSLKASRKENSGAAWLYITLFISAILLVRGGGQFVALNLAPIALVLLAKALCNLTALGSRVFYAMFSLLAFVAAILCLAVYFAPNSSLWADYLPAFIITALANAKGLEFISGILLLGAIVLFKFTRRDSAMGSLLVVCLFALLLVQPFTMFFAPSLVSHSAKYHPFGAGFGILPYGLGAPSQGILSLDTEPSTTQSPQPEPDVQTQPTLPEPTPEEPALTPEQAAPVESAPEEPASTPEEPATPEAMPEQALPTPSPPAEAAPQPTPEEAPPAESVDTL